MDGSYIRCVAIGLAGHYLYLGVRACLGRDVVSGAITKVLLQRYSPVKAIILSALIFGIFHINPAQVAGAILSGGLFAWLYYRTGSLVPGILIHILNNSLSVFLSLHYPDVKYTSDLLGEPAYWSCLAVAAVLFAVSCKVMNSYRLPATDTTFKI